VAFTLALTPRFTAGITAAAGFRSAPPAAHTSAMEDIEPVDVTIVGEDGWARDLTVRLRDAAATVGELAAALGWAAGPLAVDGVEVAATAPVVTSGLRRGSVVTARPHPVSAPGQATAVLRWTGGVDAGRSVALGAGTTVIGRAGDAHVRCRDPRVAPYECLVHVGADGGRVEPAAHAPRVGASGPVGGVGEPEAFEQLVGAGLDLGLRLVGEAPDEAKVLAAGQVLVDGGVLAGEADPLPDGLRMLGHVDAEDGRPPGVGAEDGGEDAHGRGLAGAVGPKQAQDGGRRDLEVDAGQGGDRAEALLQPFDGDGGTARGRVSAVLRGAHDLHGRADR